MTCPPPRAACVWGALTTAVGLWWRRGFLESCVLLCCSDGRIRLQTLWHFVADNIHKTLKCLLDINVILGTCFKKFKPWKKQRETQLGHFTLLKLNGTWLWFSLVIVWDRRGGPRMQLEQMLSSCYQFFCFSLFFLCYQNAWMNTNKQISLQKLVRATLKIHHTKSFHHLLGTR